MKPKKKPQKKKKNFVGPLPPLPPPDAAMVAIKKARTVKQLRDALILVCRRVQELGSRFPAKPLETEKPGGN